MAGRRGTVYIAPSASFPADGRMVDPASAWFWVSWQDDEATAPLQEDDIQTAEAAIAWGRERAEVVVIRLGHRGDTYFSAGVVHEATEDGDDPLPVWPPAGPPPEGWFTPEHNDRWPT